jgi:putative endonuclease
MKQLKLANKIGKLGEDIALKYLIAKGYTLVLRNFLTRFGEIDLIMHKAGAIHFVEVKSVKRDDLSTIDTNEHKPEDNVTHSKLARMYRTIEIYLSKTKQSENKWQIDVISVYIDNETKEAKVRMLENIIE